MTVFEKKIDQVKEIKPGTIVAKANGDLEVERFADDPARKRDVRSRGYTFPVETIPTFMPVARLWAPFWFPV